MKLKNILKHHFEISDKDLIEKSLPGNLGDAFLLKNNQIFNNVRTIVLNTGFSFSDQVHPHYASLPLSQLDVILDSRKIPFQNNVDVLLDIERKTPGQMEWDFISDGLKQNHVFHESCHAIARHLRKDLDFESSKQMQLMLTILEESFANTCEFLAVADASDPVHRVFYEWNSYVCIFEERSNIKKTLNEMGRAEVFRFFIMAHLYCNFLNERWLENDFQRVLKLAFGSEVSEAIKKTLRFLSKENFTLNPRFRYMTTSFYLKTNGYSESAEEALNFDPIQMIEMHLSLRNWINLLSRFELKT